MALEIDEPTEMVLIYSNPAKKDFIPWVIRKLPTNVNYQTLAFDEINNFKISGSKRYLYFYKGDEQGGVYAELRSVFGEQVVRTNFYNREGEVIGASYTHNDTSNMKTKLHYDARNFVTAFAITLFIILYFYSALIFVSLKGKINANMKPESNVIRSSSPENSDSI
jgi:hypothetical protein